MRRYWTLLNLLTLLALMASAFGASANAELTVPRLDARLGYHGAIAHRMAYIEEQGEELSVGDIQFLIGETPDVLQRTDDRVIANGIDSGAVWLVADVLNPTGAPIARRMSVRIGWLDRVDFYLMPTGEPPRRFKSGDTIPVHKRSFSTRVPTAEYAFPSGITRLFLRVETSDPVVVPFYFTSIKAGHNQEQFDAAFYSFVYGVMFALAAYNLMLFTGLRRRRYLFYSIYMVTFVFMTASYSGIGMALVWPSSVVWQQWAPPLLMFCFAFSGIAFATSFLQVKLRRRKLFRSLQAICLIYFALFAACYIAEERGFALTLAFSMVPIFTALMLYLGISSWVSGMTSARYYLAGTLASAIGASITALTVYGVLPYSQIGFYAVDIGMVLDAMLLALALADLVRRTQHARIAAERKAQVDHLTGLDNRRGFLPVAESLWSLVKRNNRDMCVAMIDIDHFKMINDQYGHATGDRILRQIAKVLDSSRRQGDLLARWGGEEFILLLPETDLPEACHVAERFRQNVEALTIQEGADIIHCTISVGVANRDSEDVSLDKTIVMADQALYQAKLEGRNVVCAGNASDAAAGAVTV
ncbi:diguanylate cyclase [Marinobacter arenosus]|uniref:diguanylate cyclase n=1 Tax=Marinobacter arenosus TaxID=2856822 RepID=UPI001C4BE813|nr:diguanylate cyclase [Marinobacter arenosus]MBW0148958.1 sensor domain-containing diguanylate cyclase [Marinobacter arenosus]